MNRFVILAATAFFVSACGQQSPVVRESAAAKVNSECKEGRRTGPTCEAASRALEAKEHRDAQAAFRNMVEKN